jgi:DNA repair exonuclease SbcCD ATPase subunit
MASIYSAEVQAFGMNPDVPIPPDVPVPPVELRRTATNLERVEAIEALRVQITTLEAREPELKQEIVEFEKTQRATLAELEKTRRETIAELEKTQRTTIAQLEQTQRTTIAELEKTESTTIAELEKTHSTTIAELEQTLRTEPENAEELAGDLTSRGTELDGELKRRRTELDEELKRTRSELDGELKRRRTELEEELTRIRTELAENLASTRTALDENLATTRTELAEELARMRGEHASIGPTVIESRSILGMKMSDLALEENQGHEQAIEDLKPFLDELRNDHRRVHREAERSVAEAKETLKALQAEHQDDANAALAAVEQQFQPLIDTETAGASIASTNVRLARHRLALVHPDDKDGRLACELALDAALEELDAIRVKITVLQEQKAASAHHYSHPNAEKSKRLGEKLTKRFGRH